jgi:hypothetical protein
MTNTTRAALLIRPEAKPEGGRDGRLFRSAITVAKPERQRHRASRSAWGLFHLRHAYASPNEADLGDTPSGIVDAMLAVETERFAQPPAIETIDVLTSKLHG